MPIYEYTIDTPEGGLVVDVLQGANDKPYRRASQIPPCDILFGDDIPEKYKHCRAYREASAPGGFKGLTTPGPGSQA